MSGKRRYVGRKWHFTKVKPGSATVVDTATGQALGRVKSYRTTRGHERWTAYLKVGRANEPLGTRQSRRDAGALISWKARK